MTSEWIAGVFGATGAAVGASATLTANWIAARTQLKLAAGDSEQRQADVRRAACAEYLITVDSFRDQARELVSKIESDVPQAECEAAYATYFADWQDLQRKCAPVIIAGPRELGKQAEELRSKLSGLADECDSWYNAHKDGRTRSRAARITSARESAYEVRDAFVSVAQKYAYRDPDQSGH